MRVRSKIISWKENAASQFRRAANFGENEVGTRGVWKARIDADILGASVADGRPTSMPQVIMMRAIQTRAPTLSRKMFDGTSNRKYPMKNKPAPSPKAGFFQTEQPGSMD